MESGGDHGIFVRDPLSAVGGYEPLGEILICVNAHFSWIRMWRFRIFSRGCEAPKAKAPRLWMVQSGR